MCGGIVGRILPNASLLYKTKQPCEREGCFSIALKSLLARKKENCGKNCEDRRDYQKGFMNGEIPHAEIIGEAYRDEITG
jgi:hypothetical protein